MAKFSSWFDVNDVNLDVPDHECETLAPSAAAIKAFDSSQEGDAEFTMLIRNEGTGDFFKATCRRELNVLKCEQLSPEEAPAEPAAPVKK